MENYTLLRKLEPNEINKNRGEICPNFMATLQITSKIDLFANLDQLKNGIQIWKKMNKILQAKVVKADQDYFYAVEENSSTNLNLENVHFLKINSKLDEKLNKVLIDDSLLFDLLIEKMISEPINFEEEHGSLWRMIILELKRSNDEITYEMIWLLHHVIGDGVSAKENLPLLLSIIYKSIRSEQIELKDYGVYPGTSKVFEKEINSPITFTDIIPKIFKPDFIDPEKARKNASQLYDKYFVGRDIDQLDFNLIDLNSRRTYATLSNLIHISKEINNIKPIQFILFEEDFGKLMKK